MRPYKKEGFQNETDHCIGKTKLTWLIVIEIERIKDRGKYFVSSDLCTAPRQMSAKGSLYAK
jgi:hypothetical protein